MRTIKANCKECKHDVELKSSTVRLLKCQDISQFSYTFVCPNCSVINSVLTTDKVAGMLINYGVKLFVWHLPEEIYEPHIGSVVTYDDLLQFHFLLEKQNWLEQQVALFDQKSQKPELY